LLAGCDTLRGDVRAGGAVASAIDADMLNRLDEGAGLQAAFQDLLVFIPGIV
jgi:hypothetical protein